MTDAVHLTGASEEDGKKVGVPKETGSDAKLERIFSAGLLGQLHVKNRLIMTATGLGAYGADPLRYSENLTGFVEARAAGGLGAMILSALGPARIDSPDSLQSRDHDSILAVLRGLVETAHRGGMPLGMQLNHQGREANPKNTFAYVGPSPIPWSPRLPAPKELSGSQARTIVQRYRAAAGRIRDVGMDFVEVHGGHGYLVHQFLSARSNHRNDEYGGENGDRHRFLLEILGEIRAEVGDDFTIGVRLSGRERVAEGVPITEVVELVKTIESEQLADYVNVSGGTYGSNPVIVAPYSSPAGYNVQDARSINDSTHLPIIVAGRLWDPDLMAEVLVTKAADFIGLGRALWADPELPNKLRQGRAEDVRHAIGCNQGCIDRTGPQVRTCLVNPAFGREREYTLQPAATPKNVLVIGAGIAGMEASRLLDARGHRVTLIERDIHLGGKWRLAAMAPGKEEFQRLSDWLERKLRQSDVHILQNQTANVDTIRQLNPQEVVLATGAVDRGPTWARDEIVTIQKALEEPWRVGPKVVIIGSGRAALEAALCLRARGCEVIVAGESSLGTDMGLTARFHLLNQMEELGIRVERRLGEGIPDAAKLAELLAGLSWASTSTDTADVVWTSRLEPVNELGDVMDSLGVPWRAIGDALDPRDGLFAMDDAALVGRTV